jgi:ribosomal protein L7/L12
MTWYWIAAAAAVVGRCFLSRRGERSGSNEVRLGSIPPSPATIDALLRAGQKIEAIKQYRAMHGVGLKEAKDAVDARARELGT